MKTIAGSHHLPTRLLIIAGVLLLLAIPGVGAGQVAKAPYLLFPGADTEMQLLWQLDETAVCTVEWGFDTSYSLGNVPSVEYGDDHQHTYTFTGLTPDQIYCYRVTAAGEPYTGTFRTAPTPGTTSLKFLAYGDTRSYPMVHDSVAAPDGRGRRGTSVFPRFQLSLHRGGSQRLPFLQGGNHHIRPPRPTNQHPRLRILPGGSLHRYLDWRTSAGHTVPSGQYFARFKTATGSVTGKMLRVR